MLAPFPLPWSLSLFLSSAPPAAAEDLGEEDDRRCRVKRKVADRSDDEGELEARWEGRRP